MLIAGTGGGFRGPLAQDRRHASNGQSRFAPAIEARRVETEPKRYWFGLDRDAAEKSAASSRERDRSECNEERGAQRQSLNLSGLDRWITLAEYAVENFRTECGTESNDKGGETFD